MSNGINWEEWGFSISTHDEERYKVLSKTNDYSVHSTKNPYTYFSKPIKGNLHGRKAYSRFVRICRECFSEKVAKEARYKLCDEWLDYCAFEDWYNENYYELEGERVSLTCNFFDKNNKLYSPETCAFIPQKIISWLRRDDELWGIIKMNNTYAPCCFINDRKSLGVTESLDEAILVRNIFTLQMIKKETERLYKNKIPQNVYDYIMNMDVRRFSEKWK